MERLGAALLVAALMAGGVFATSMQDFLNLPAEKQEQARQMALDTSVECHYGECYSARLARYTEKLGNVTTRGGYDAVLHYLNLPGDVQERIQNALKAEMEDCGSVLPYTSRLLAATKAIYESV